MDGKLIKSIGIVLGIFLLVIFLLVGLSSCGSGGKKSSKTKYTYEKLRDKMIEIAKKHYEDNPKEMPAEDGDSKTYTLKKMINDEKLSEVTVLFNNEDMKCDGSVTVLNNNGYYAYVPYLKCSAGKNDKYETTYLADKIKEDSLVTSSNGLYQQNEEYIFRGKKVNNYFKFSNSKYKYRILGINPDGSIRLVSTKNISGVIWDNRYNIEFLSRDGINDFFANDFNSGLKDRLESEFKTSILFSNETRAYIPSQTLCVGKRSIDDNTKDGSTECAEKLEGQVLGALTIYETFRISLDENCLVINDGACANYNWLYSSGINTWLLTASADSSRDVFRYSSGRIETVKASRTGSVYPVFNLTDKAIYKSGTGTEKDPYEIFIPELDIVTKKKK